MSTESRNMIRIGDRAVGSGHPCFIIAEGGVNHNGDVALAHRIVDAAADADADAVKFQTFNANSIATSAAPKAEYQRTDGESGESQLDMLARLELSRDAHFELRDHCRERDIIFLSTPFDEASVDFLETLGMAAYKIGSGELTNLPLLDHIAGKGRPMILSTGMANMDEVRTAVDSMRSAGNTEAALMHCVSCYPAKPQDANLLAMSLMRSDLELPVGYSDHTEGTTVALAAVALGACILEKHLTLDRTLAGPDQAASTEPDEFAELVRTVRIAESALGDGRKEPRPCEMNVRDVARRSLVTACDIAAGSEVSSGDIVLKRPGTGLPASALLELVGRTIKSDIPEGTLITVDMFE